MIPQTNALDISEVLEEQTADNWAVTNPPEVSSSPLWNEQRAAVLLGFQDESDLALHGSAESLQPEPGDVEVPNPREQLSRPSFSQQPWAKVGLVSGLSLLVCMGTGMIFHAMTQVALKPENSHNVKGDLNAVDILNIPTSSQAENSEKLQATLLTESALGKQEKLLAALSEPRPSPATPPDLSTGTPQPAKLNVAASPSRLIPALPVTPSPVSVPSLPANFPTTALPTPIPSPTDPLQQWQTASQIGSYSLDSALSDSGTRDTLPEVVPISQTATPTLTAANTTGNQVPLYSTVTNLPTSMGLPELPVAVSPLPVSSESAMEEAAILNQQALRLLPIGSRAAARLLTTIAHEISPTAQDDVNSLSQKVVIRLEAPLWGQDNLIVLPPGSEVIAELKSIGGSGLVHLSAIAVRVEGTEYRLPLQTLTIRGQGGQPLLARQFYDRGPEIASMDAAQVLLGGLSQVGEVANRPQSSTVITGLGTTTSTVQNSDPNLAAAMMQGGFSILSQQLSSRNQQAIQSAGTQPNFWFLEQGTPVEVFVNQSQQF